MNAKSPTIAVIGLGLMGVPMTRNLVEAGLPVTVYNRTRSKAVELARELDGLRVADTIAEAATADVIITLLNSIAAVEQVALNDIIPAMRPGAVYADMSTVSPELSRRVAAAGAERGVHVLDAPISGGPTGAEEASLSIMVGGTEEGFALALPAFEALGTTVRLLGPAGAGQVVKAANQLVVGGTYALIGEAVTLMEAAGVDDVSAALDVLAGGLAGSRILDLKRHAIVDRSFVPGARVAIHHKDMGIILDEARQSLVPVPFAALIAQYYTALVARGDIELDHSATVRVSDMLAAREK